MASEAPERSIWKAVRGVLLPAAAAIWTALGTFWTIFAWYHQEVIVPSTAPVNLVTEVTVQEAGTDHTRPGSGDNLDAIQVTVTADNVSTKTIHLLANYWDAWAGKVTSRPTDADEAAWLGAVNAAQVDQDNRGQPDYAIPGRYYTTSQFERVALGNLFPTTYVLQPKETISASALFYVPKGTFDMVHVEVHIPTTERSDVSLMFVIDGSRVRPRIFRVAPNGARNEVAATANTSALKIQETEAFREISLKNTPEDLSTGGDGAAPARRPGR